MEIPSSDPGDARPGDAAQGSGDLRRLLLVAFVLCLPIAILALGVLAWLRWNTTETFGPLAAGHGWIAFEQQVERAWPVGGETSVWLGRSIAERGTWHRLAPTDAVRVHRFTWVTPKHLRIAASPEPAPDWATAVEDIAIEWVR